MSAAVTMIDGLQVEPLPATFDLRDLRENQCLAAVIDGKLIYAGSVDTRHLVVVTWPDPPMEPAAT